MFPDFCVILKQSSCQKVGVYTFSVCFRIQIHRTMPRFSDNDNVSGWITSPTESQNHTTIYVGRDLQRSSSLTPCSKQVYLDQVAQGCICNITKDEDSTTPLGDLFQCLMEKQVFQYLIRIFYVLNLCLLLLFLWLCICKSLALSSLYLSVMV